MTILIPRKREFWHRKPQGAQEINWKSSVAPALAVAILDNRNIVDGVVFFANTTSQVGDDIVCADGTTNAYLDESPLSTADGGGSGDYSLFIRAKISTGDGNVSNLIGNKDDTQGSPYNQGFLGAHMTANGGYDADSIALFTYPSSNSETVVIASSIDTSIYQDICGTRIGSDSKLYVDSQSATNTHTPNDIYQPGVRFIVGHSGKATNDDAGDFKSPVALAWNRGLSEIEYRELRVAPYQVFKRKKTVVFIPGAADTTAPVLTSPTGTKTGSTTADGTVSTDEANGTLYYLASTNATETAATIKTGSSQAVTATGSQAVSFTGLTASTLYYAHYVHDDAASNESNVVTSASFTTDAIITANDLQQSQSLGQVSLTQHGVIAVNDLNHSQTLDQPAITQHNILNADSLQQAQNLSLADLIQHNALSTDSLQQPQSLGQPTLTQHNILSVNGLQQVQTLGQVTLSAGGAVVANDLQQPQELSQVALTQYNVLIVGDIQQAQDLSQVSLAGSVALSVADLQQAQELGQSVLAVAFSITVDDLQQAQELAQSALTEHQVLVVGDITQEQLLSLANFGAPVIGCLDGTIVIATLLNGSVSIAERIGGDVDISPLFDGDVTIQ